MKRRVFDLPASGFGWQVARDIFFLICLLVMSFYAVYLASEDVSRIFFLSLLVFFVLSKKDYFWFAFFFIIAQGPGYFFSDYAASSQYRLPFYNFVAGMSFTPIDFFVVIALVKALLLGKRSPIQLKLPLLLLLSYVAFSLVITSSIYGLNVDIIAWNMRWLFYYSTIISFRYLARNKKEVYSFIILVLPLTFFILFTQAYFIVTGNEFINLFSPGYRSLASIVLTGVVRPYIGGEVLVFFCYAFAMVMLVNREWRSLGVLLYLVITVAFISVIISATRQWFVVFSFILLGYVVIARKRFFSWLGIIAVIFALLGVLTYTNILPSNVQFQSSWLRIQQIFDIARGNIHAVDTADNRLFNQLPIILGAIKQNPVIGYGFTAVTMYYYDNDLGFVNTILMFGCAGFLLLLYFIARLLGLLFSASARLSNINTLKLPLKTILIAWLGVLVICFATQDLFTFYFDKVFFISIMLALTEFFLAQARREENFIRNSMTLQPSNV